MAGCVGGLRRGWWARCGRFGVLLERSFWLLWIEWPVRGGWAAGGGRQAWLPAYLDSWLVAQSTGRER
eukprot:6042879-Alexandrium_andersonii.AAC.1